jgi:hypothetical protein
MRNTAGYRRLYQELAMMMLARHQFHTGRDSIGFTFSELQEIVERDEGQMPILRYMTDLGFEV